MGYRNVRLDIHSEYLRSFIRLILMYMSIRGVEVGVWGGLGRDILGD